jgi:uncharacterized protein YjiS (DUF1127 family)
MTALSELLKTATAPFAGAALVAGQVAVRRLSGLWQLVANHMAARRLADLDDRMLADVGLNRSDVRDAVYAPLWTDPTRLLALRVGERRRQRRLASLVGATSDLPVVDAPSIGPDAEASSVARISKLRAI